MLYLSQSLAQFFKRRRIFDAQYHQVLSFLNYLKSPAFALRYGLGLRFVSGRNFISFSICRSIAVSKRAMANDRAVSRRTNGRGGWDTIAAKRFLHRRQ